MIKKPTDTTIRINLDGPEGNAFVLLGKALNYAKKLGLDGDKITSEMKSGDYNNLLRVFNENFSFIVLETTQESILEYFEGKE